jgi:hypothetical protein
MRHRIGLALTGGVLLCAGVAALVGGLGVFGTGRIDGSAYRLATGGEWFWPSMAGIGAALVIAGLIGMIVQLRTTLARLVALGRIAPRIAVRVSTTNLIDEISGLPGVQEVRVRLTGTRLRPRLVVTVTCDPHTELSLLHEEIADGAIPRSRVALGRSELRGVICFRIAEPA